MARKRMQWLRLGMVLLLLGGFAGIIFSGARGVPTAAATGETGSPTNTNNLTTTATPSAPLHMVISEFASRGPKGDSDEFVELYNPTGASVNISGWLIRRSSDCGSTVASVAVIYANVILLPGQHYLLTSTSTLSSISGANQTFSPGIADNGGIALTTSTGAVVDMVGMCISTVYREGGNLNPLIGDASQSYERRPGGDTACYDTDNNAGDFRLISPPHPQNKASPVVMCAGVPNFTPSFTPTFTVTRTVPNTATTIPGSVVINEFLPHARNDWNLDGTANVGDEYIELINMGAGSVNIQGWRLDNGPGTTSYSLPAKVLLSHEMAVFYHADTGIPISDGGGTVRLVKSDGHTADINNYPPVEAAEVTWCRRPDGNGEWGFDCKPTPGQPNMPLEQAKPTPRPTTAGQAFPDCSWADNLPEALVSPECGSSGAGVWQAPTQDLHWLPVFRKWEVFIE